MTNRRLGALILVAIMLGLLAWPTRTWAAIGIVQQTCQFGTNYGVGGANPVLNFTLGTVGTPITKGDLVIIGIGQGCNRQFNAQDCPAPQVSLTINGTPSPLYEIDAFDPSHLVAVFEFLTCSASATGVGTVNIAGTAFGPPLAVPQMELGANAADFTGNDSSSLTSCLDLPDISNPAFFNQCNGAQGTPESAIGTTVLPTGATRPSFRNTSNVMLYSFTYDRASNHAWTISGNPFPVDFEHEAGAPSFLNPQNTGQSFVMVTSLLASATSPPYDWTLTIGSGGFSTSPYMNSCIMAFDSAGGVQHLASAKKKGLLF